MTRRRALVEVITALKEADTKPRVTITKTADGSVTYSVTATGRNVGQARERAQEAFAALRVFVEKMRGADLTGSLKKSLAEMGHK